VRWRSAPHEVRIATAERAVDRSKRLRFLLTPDRWAMTTDNDCYRGIRRKAACQHAFHVLLRGASGGTLSRWTHPRLDIHTRRTLVVHTTATGTDLSRGASNIAIVRFQPLRWSWPATSARPRKHATPTANRPTRPPLCGDGPRRSPIATARPITPPPQPTARCAKPSRQSRRPRPPLPDHPARPPRC
jgi:hypothetical protein